MLRLLLLVPGVLFAISASGMDYVCLKTGRMVEGAILRQDTIAVYMTDWESRAVQFPPLQVFARDEIESIWFEKPKFSSRMRSYYEPAARTIEFGGGATFQTWQTSSQDRREVLQLSLLGAFSITPVFGLEANADITYPFGDRDTESWDNLDLSHQVTMSVVGHLPLKTRVVPYVLVGGGSAEDIPIAGVLLTDAGEVRSTLHAGAGIKYGFEGLGFRMELRHTYYTWQESRLQLDPSDLNNARTSKVNLDADATVIRFSIFGYLKLI